MRFHLRVDGVLIRIFDTRFFHDFSKSYFLREFQAREGSIAALKAQGFGKAVMLNTDAISRFLPIKQREMRKMKLIERKTPTKDGSS